MNRLYRHIIGTTILFLILHGCMVDETLLNSGEKPVPDRDEYISFNLSVHTNSYSIPVTRATLDKETEIEKIWVLVFEGVGENAVFVDTATVHITGTGITGINGTVTLRRRASTCQLLFLANLPENIGNTVDNNTVDVSTLEKLKYQLDGLSAPDKTLKNISDNILLTPKLDVPQTTAPYRDMPLPMSQLIEMKYGIGTSSSSDNSIDLSFKRSVAKMTVETMPEVWTSESNFWMGGIVAILDVPSQGRIHQYSGGAMMQGNSINYQSSSGHLLAKAENRDGSYIRTTEKEPVYLYEAREDNTISVIIEGNWKHKACYYKLTMTDNISTYVPLRNCEYVFTVTKAYGPGYETVEDAIASLPSNVNIDYTIQLNDLGVYEVIANNDYYLGVTNSVFIAYTTPEGKDENGDEIPTYYNEAFSVITNCTRIFPNANSVTDNRDEVAGAFGVISPAEIPISTTTEASVTDVIGINVYSWLQWYESAVLENESEYRKNAYVILKLGNIEKKVQVRRRPAIPNSGKTLYYKPTNDDPGSDNMNYYCISGEVDKGNDWIRLLPSSGAIRDNTDLITVDDGEIQIQVEPNTGISREGVVYLTTAGALGDNVGQRIKIHITQLGL